MRAIRCATCALVFMVAASAIGLLSQISDAADEKAASAKSKLPVIVEENFSKGADRWQPASPEGWKVIDGENGQKLFSQFKHIIVKTPHRSPWNIALLKDVTVGDFDLEVKVHQTGPEKPHRDVCLVFNYQDPAHMYYVHFASAADPHANQVFIVNGADRLKITEQESKGVKWTDGFHRLKIVRRTGDGLIEAYFDDMEKPIMVAHDKNFQWGQIGIGTFDDTADYAEVKLSGQRATKSGASEPINGVPPTQKR